MAATGFVDRIKGKTLDIAASLTQFGAGGATFRNGGNIYTNQSASGILSANTTSENTLDTYSLPANSLDVPGRQLSISAFGSFGNTTHSKTVKLYFGSELISSGAQTITTGWSLSMVVQKDAANSQIIGAQNVSGSVHGGCTTQSGAETDTAAITIKVTGQTGTAATGDVVLNGWQITGLN